MPRRDDSTVKINDTYFRRFLVPVIITILVLCGIAVIIATPPGTPVDWKTFNSAMGAIKLTS